jgi:lipopolysaccharide/colanic/teichoic acid biosynthesis glycosyltransferase
MTLCNVSNSPQDILSSKFLCINKKFNRKTKTTEEVYKMPLSKRILIFLLHHRYFYLHPFLLVVILAIRLESKGKVYYIKRVGRQTFDFINLDQCAPVQTNC